MLSCYWILAHFAQTRCCRAAPGPPDCQPSQHTGTMYPARMCHQIASPLHPQLQGQIGGHGCCQMLLSPAPAQSQMPVGTEAVMLFMHSLRSHKPHVEDKVLLLDSCWVLVGMIVGTKTRALMAGQLLLLTSMGSPFAMQYEVGRQTGFPALCRLKTKWWPEQGAQSPAQ